MSKAAESASSTESFEDRAARALTEPMTVIDDRLDQSLRDEEFLVVTGSGTYVVDMVAEACDCPDALHRAPDGGCKHIQRVALARGERTIPGWVDRSAIDPELGQHLTASPRIATPDGRTEVLD
ncbi:hypothetical protein ACFPM1_07875 [Halorubrum rubrum]|uniref:SWIM-type domain-containing protein n=1 Tax=Halorubrum rubrum TaxID=1126240 RepID=A0ABD5R1F6_9EURY|nr:hypothetical protein [Halorubrum rubrum]